MMRVTVKGLVIGGSFGILFTSALLWSQCNPPASALKYAPPDNPTYQQKRMPLQTRHQSISTSEDHGIGGGPIAPAEDNYVEDEYVPPAVGSPAASRKDGLLIHRGNRLPSHRNRQDESVSSLSDIPCIINQETSINCKRDENEVYVPFTFLHNYFEVYGRIGVSNEGEGDVFEWSHSYGRVYEPETPYDPYGLFLNFKLYNVEARDRVKCISAMEGVPISTQWSVSGYTYPIQIAQFGLAHYCKYLSEDPPSRTILEDGHNILGKWKYDSGKISHSLDITLASHVLHFRTISTKPSSPGISLKYNGPSDRLILSLILRIPRAPSTNTSVTAVVEIKDKRSEVFHIHYIRSSTLIHAQDHHIFYGLGDNPGWRKITRNLLIDLQKGLAAAGLPKKYKKISRSKLRLLSIELRGEGSLDNLTISTAEHLNHFYDAANWLLLHQDDKGGWTIPVPRKVVSGLLELKAGWYSAMAQGQAISLLVRAAHHSGDSRYLKAAVMATGLFNINSTEGGIRTYFPGGYSWYEEYPTTPSLFVLNGFIYSLLGLYDLNEISMAPKNSAGDLFEAGMRSLKKLLPLFDSGGGSFYDLRHFTTHLAPNIARWDYHTTHITQLMLLAAIDNDPMLDSTVQRWKDYMNGRRANHN